MNLDAEIKMIEDEGDRMIYINAAGAIVYETYFQTAFEKIGGDVKLLLSCVENNNNELNIFWERVKNDYAEVRHEQ